MYKNQKYAAVGRLLGIVYGLALLLVCLLLVVGASAYRVAQIDLSGSVRAVTGFAYEAGGGSGTVSLPYSFAGLPARSRVVLTAALDTRHDDNLLVKTSYAPMRLFVDGVLLYECGQVGSYPEWLHDPPTILATVALPDGAKELRMEYLTPTQRDMLNVPTPMLGSKSALLLWLFGQNAVLLFNSFLLVIIGLAALLVTIPFLRGIPIMSAFIWFGLLSVSAGMWGIGECNFTGLLFPYPSLLLLMAFSGLFAIPIPFLLYGFKLLNPRNKLPARLLTGLYCLCFLAALVLQLTGIMTVMRSMYLFHILCPLAFVIFAAVLIWEHIKYDNKTARRFIVPTLLLALFSVLEVVNYNLRFTDMLSLFFTSGMLLFILSIGVLGVYYVRDSARLSAEHLSLTEHARMNELQLSFQREQYITLQGSIEKSRKIRHDVRHQLAVLSRYAETGNNDALRNYIANLLGSLPDIPEQALCENYAVNAVVGHYMSLAEKAGIETDVRITLPEANGRILSSDLSIVFGNLFENAVEACGHITVGKRFIHARAEIRQGFFILTILNSFDGLSRSKDGVFYSRKREGQTEGIGLSSVRAIAEKHDGFCEFEATERQFESAVTLQLAARD